MRKVEQILEKASPREFNSSEEYGAHVRKLFAEWRQDHEMAKERDTSGREPEARPINAAGAKPKKELRRTRIRERDIPF